jgi:hypothetical protein
LLLVKLLLFTHSLLTKFYLVIKNDKNTPFNGVFFCP